MTVCKLCKGTKVAESMIGSFPCPACAFGPHITPVSPEAAPPRATTPEPQNFTNLRELATEAREALRRVGPPSSPEQDRDGLYYPLLFLTEQVETTLRAVLRSAYESVRPENEAAAKWLTDARATLASSPSEAGTLEHLEIDGPPFTDEQAAALGRRLAERRSGRQITEVDIGSDLSAPSGAGGGTDIGARRITCNARNGSLCCELEAGHGGAHDECAGPGSRSWADESTLVTEYVSKVAAHLTRDMTDVRRQNEIEAAVGKERELRVLLDRALATLTARAAEAERKNATHAELIHAGALLSNVAYNLAQLPSMDSTSRRSLDEARKRWDAARAALAPARGDGETPTPEEPTHG